LDGSAGEHRLVPWSPGAPPELEDALLRSFEDEPGPDGGDLIHWTCPRCLHRHSRLVFRDEEWWGLAEAGALRWGELALSRASAPAS
jgi:hypothetical protein